MDKIAGITCLDTENNVHIVEVECTADDIQYVEKGLIIDNVHFHADMFKRVMICNNNIMSEIKKQLIS